MRDGVKSIDEPKRISQVPACRMIGYTGIWLEYLFNINTMNSDDCKIDIYSYSFHCR